MKAVELIIPDVFVIVLEGVINHYMITCQASIKLIR